MRFEFAAHMSTFQKIIAAWFLIAGFALLSPALKTHAGALQEDPDAEFAVEELSVETVNGIYRFSVEIADLPQRRAKGLMHREKMLPTHGMLFDFGVTQPVAMWMKNTVLSLDMIFIRPDGTVARIAERTKPFSTEIIPSGEPVSHVLEVNAGIARLIGLKAGDTIRHRFFGNAR